MAVEFKRFTDPDVLKTINVKHLDRFFDVFKDDLADVAIPVPEAPPGSGAYSEAWIAILKSPEKLPQGFSNAVGVIEDLAAPQKRNYLDSAVQ